MAGQEKANENFNLADYIASGGEGEKQEEEQSQEEEQEQDDQGQADHEESEDDSGSEEQEQEEEQEQQESVSPEVEKASSDGWVSKDQWVEKGKDPDDWVSAKKFNERGSMIGQIKALQKQNAESEKTFSQRLDRVNNFHEQQLKTKLAELKTQRREAIEQADIETVEELDAQIDEIKAVAPEETKTDETKEEDETAAPGEWTKGENKSMKDWNGQNEWIDDDDDPRSHFAKGRFNKHLSAGKSVDDAITALNKDMAKAFPKKNAARDNAPQQESNKSKPGNKAQAKTLQWSELKADEIKMFNGMPNAWGSKKEFLQTVADIRKEDK